MTATKHSTREIKIREMRVEDISPVYRLGYQLFHSLEPTTLYRTWDAYEVTTNFNQDPRLSLVAESPSGRIVGFALGKTYENESGGWKYGHLLWIGITPKWQRSHVGAQLYREMERRMHEDGVRMMFIDAAKSNIRAVRFFRRMGYSRPETEVWMSKVVQGQQRKKIRLPRKPGLPKRFRKRARPRTVS
jgi:ribosomal protein S18 acetylase RimI-like enzyme